MHFNDGIVEFGFDCKARKLSDKSISNYQKQLRYLARFSRKYVALICMIVKAEGFLCPNHELFVFFSHYLLWHDKIWYNVYDYVCTKNERSGGNG